jgi:capsular exopolysaccharide synthesis family protein
VSKNFELLEIAGKDLRRQPESQNPSPKRAQLPGETLAGLDTDAEQQIDWLKIIGIVQRRWRLSACFAFLVVLLSAFVTSLMRPMYEAEARIEIDPPGETFSLDGPAAASNDLELMQTQARVLESDSLAIGVIRKLRLDQNDEVIAGAKPQRDGGATAPLRDALQLTPQENIALERFKALLSVKRDTSSRLIFVGFTSHNPELAAAVANALVQFFIEQNFQTRHDAIMKSSDWLARQLDDIRTKMEESNRALAQFQGAIGVTDAGNNENTFSEHMGDLTRQLTQAEAERIQLQALLKSAQSSPDSLPEVRSNPVVQHLSQSLAEQRAQLSQLLVVYGKNHPTTKKLQSQIDELQSQLDAQMSAVLNSLKGSYAAAEARERLMSAEIKGTTKELNEIARYNSLKKDLETNRELYNTLYAKVKEAGIAAASKSFNIRVVDQARVPIVPVRPRWVLNLLAGLVGGVLGGVVLALVREQFDNTLRSPDDIKKWIGRPTVSIIPAIGEFERQNAALPWPKRMLALLPGATPENGKHGKEMFLLETPDSPEAEALHGLYGTLMLGQQNPPQVVLIASPSPGEGKTTVAMNLSFALAKNGNTCLLDADMRKGRVANAFGLRSKPGLGDVLVGASSLEGVLLGAPALPNLSILPRGSSHGNFSQLICSDAMRQIVENLRVRFRFVVIDSVPILPFVDTRALSTMADAVILVGRSGITTCRAMERCIELLAEIRSAPILHVVVNGAEMNSAYYKYYRYGDPGYSNNNSTSV